MLHFCLSTHDLTTSTVKNKLKSWMKKLGTWMKKLRKIYMRVGRMGPEVVQDQTLDFHRCPQMFPSALVEERSDSSPKQWLLIELN